MTKVKLSGTLSLEVVDVLVELSPEPRNGMVEMLDDETGNRWQSKRLKKMLKDCGGRVFYQMHPEATNFLKCFCFARTYSNNEKYLSLCTMQHGEGSCPGVAIVEKEWRRSKDVDHMTLSNYFNTTGGWVMLGPVAPTADLLPVVLSSHFTKFETNVMGLPDRKIREITKALLADHYIQFTMRDRKGGFNSLLELVPAIVEAVKKPRFPTPEIQELLVEQD